VTPILSAIVLWGAAAVAIAGALGVVLARGALRLALGLGVMMLALAAVFAVVGATFVAIAQVFLYVGGVLVLLLFALMLVSRSASGEPIATTRSFLAPAIAGATVAAAVVVVLAPVVRGADLIGLPAQEAAPAEPDAASLALSSALLGPMLPHFEAIGVLLLAALVAVVALSSRRT
jgi:NADH-quinone oxidoreductase subunit J